MSDKVKIFAFCLAVFSLTAIAFMGLGGLIGYQRGAANCRTKVVTDTIVKTDTVTLVEARVDTMIRYVDRLKPIAVHDTIVKGDTIYAYLPYEYRLYEIPDTVKVWYSGVEPCVDSVKVYNHTTTITNTIVNTEYKMPRLTADLGAGALYHENKVNPYLLGEVRYNRPKATFSAFGAINHEGRWGVGGNVTYRLNIIK